MESSWHTFGHSAVKSILERQLGQGKFAHAYLFQGPSGVGKRTLAEEFAKKILNSEKLHSHPDFVSLGITDDELAAQAVRQLIFKLAVKPFAGKYTVAIINDAHLLSLAAVSSLLKTLEEPSASSIIILVAEGAVLATVSSRCQVFRFSPLALEECKLYAKLRGQNYDDEAYALCGGSPGRLSALAGDAASLLALKEKIKQLDRLQTARQAEKILAVYDFAELENEELSKIFESWLYSTRSRLAEHPHKYSLLAAIIRALRQLRTNMNKKFILQKLFLGN